MYLKHIVLENFRNLANQKIDLDPLTNVFLGDNGQGKTNFLEALYLCSGANSFRGSKYYEAVNFDYDYFALDLKTSQKKLSLTVVSSPRKKIRYLIDDQKTSFFDFLGNFNSVIFSPLDMMLIKGRPQFRRNYFDGLLVRLDKEYAYLLQKFEKILKHRNSLLKQIQENPSLAKDLDFWDQEYFKACLPIFEKRTDLLNSIKKDLSIKYQDLSKNKDLVNLVYEQKKDHNDFFLNLQERREKDIIIGTTTIGPHRDYFDFFLNEKLAQDFASQGEVRSLILALKLVEIELLEKKYQTKVVLLLDDVFSELDLKRQESLLALIKNHQSFLTTTHLPKDLKNLFNKTFKVSQGVLSV